MKVTSLFLVALTGFSGIASAHSWIDQLTVLSGQSPVGKPGYIRGYATRTTGVNTDVINTGKILDPAKVSVCKPEQRGGNKAGLPRLSAKPGDFVRGTYTENGHVSKLEPGRVSGVIYWYGSVKPKVADTMLLNDMLKWTKDGKGGNGAGFLLGRSNFDDGLCAESNPSDISKKRLGGAGKPSKACTSTFQIPKDAKGTLSVYWVWDYRNAAKTNQEWYTSCMDIDVAGGVVDKKGPTTTTAVPKPTPTTKPGVTTTKPGVTTTKPGVTTKPNGTPTAKGGNGDKTASPTPAKPVTTKPGNTVRPPFVKTQKPTPANNNNNAAIAAPSKTVSQAAGQSPSFTPGVVPGFVPGQVKKRHARQFRA